MIGSSRKRLAIAVRNDGIGYVYCSGDNLLDWGVSTEAVKSIEGVFLQATKWMRYYRPRMVITEECIPASRKGKRTQAHIETVCAAARELGITYELVVRVRRFKNKHQEACAIAKRYPELEDWVPEPRRLWDREARELIYFEAMTLWLAHAGIILPKEPIPPSDSKGDGQLPLMPGML